MTPKEFIQKEYDEFIPGDFTPEETYRLMEGYAKCPKRQMVVITHKSEEVNSYLEVGWRVVSVTPISYTPNERNSLCYVLERVNQ